jgi:choline dehydrogenase-like flavoprotein
MQCEQLAEAEPLKSVLLKKEGRRLPDKHHANDLEAAKEFIRAEGSSNYHYCGTCAIMPREFGGVVDERLLVHGTSNLRVVDASIFPVIPLGNTQATVYAVAEKAADIVRQDLSR